MKILKESLLNAYMKMIILVQWKTREPKPVGKGKVTVKKKQILLMNDIVEAKVMIKF